METFLVLLFFIVVIFFGFFYGSRGGLIATLVSLAVTEIFVVARIIMQKESFIVPGAILGVFLAAYFLFIFSLIRFYLKRDEDQYKLFTEYYDDAVKKFEMLEKKESALKEENRKLDRELDDTVSFYENIKNITATLDFAKKLELMAGFIRSIADFSEGKLIIIGADGGARKVEKVYNISAVEGTEQKVVYQTDVSENDALYVKLLGEFDRGFNPLFADVALKGDYRGLVKGEHKTIGAVPLSSENDLLGVVVVFDADRKSFEKIQNLGPQLAMELKKIKLYDKVKELSIIDGLTGLYLRRYFLEILESEIDRANRNKQPLSFLIADVDNFKNFNDKYGHLAGDILLREIAAIIKNEARSVDLIGRYGGDEIAMALPKADVNIATQVAERMRSTVKAHHMNLAEDDVRVSLSIGISSYPLNCSNAADMIEKADKALYKAKEEGRDRVILYQG